MFIFGGGGGVSLAQKNLWPVSQEIIMGWRRMIKKRALISLYIVALPLRGPNLRRTE